MRRKLFLFLLAAALLTVPVFADMGPKPQLTVRVENGPEELYYLDILEEGKPYPYPDNVPGGLKGNYTEEERAPLAGIRRPVPGHLPAHAGPGGAYTSVVPAVV